MDEDFLKQIKENIEYTKKAIKDTENKFKQDNSMSSEEKKKTLDGLHKNLDATIERKEEIERKLEEEKLKNK